MTTATASATTSIMNPIIQSTIQAFEMMIGTTPKKVGVRLHSDDDIFHTLSAVIGLAGDVKGSVCLTLPATTAKAAVKAILDMDVDDDSRLLRDTVGEFANVVAGTAKDMLVDCEVELGLPNLIRGDHVRIMFPEQAQPMRIEFESEIGSFAIVFGLVMR